MINNELYINGKLCDLNEGFSIRLNRQLLNPGELNTKDAQFSYSISIPGTETNHTIFNRANVEETRDKFNIRYTAEYYANSVRIFKGNFRLSEITRDSYKGNLYIPALKTIRDIFGELKLNQNPEYRIPMSDFVPSINGYNEAAALTPQPAIFPYVLYGLLPKIALNRDDNNFSSRTLWDSTVRYGIQDLPPAINPLNMLKHIFNSQGYQLIGSAFDDEKLARIYMSYKNSPDYSQPWNYGKHGKIVLSGLWGSSHEMRDGLPGYSYERGVNQSSDEGAEGFAVYSCDLSDCRNVAMNIIEDPGGNVSKKSVVDQYGITWINTQIRVPATGFYRVFFKSNLTVIDSNNWRETDGVTGVQHVSGRSDDATNNLDNNIYEVRLMRDRKTADFGLAAARIDASLYLDNLPQDSDYENGSLPKYVPTVDPDGQINFVDAKQDPKLITGFAFGRGNQARAGAKFMNPLDPTHQFSQILFGKPALSWDNSSNDGTPIRAAIDSPGYLKYGHLGSFDSEGDNPDIDLDYSAWTRANGKVLNAIGTPVDPDPNILTARVAGAYYINSITGFQTPATGWEVTNFIDMRDFTDLTFTADIPAATNLAVVAYYDINKQFIGVGVLGPTTGTDSYTAEPITAPTGGVYVRVSGPTGALVVDGTDATTDNVILVKFALQKFYTYTIEAPSGSGYTGLAYVFASNAPGVPPAMVIPFIEGKAVFNTTGANLSDVPTLTIYLATQFFDVDGTLTINRQIVGASQDAIGYEHTNKYLINLDNAPPVWAKRGQHDGSPADTNWYGEGQSACVVWLEAGELLTVASVSGEGRFRQSGMHSTYGWTEHIVQFDLTIEPFRTDADWLKVDLAGRGTAVMDWNDTPNFDTNDINLVGFLSADMKTDDFIDNFCKAFNLRLSQIDAGTFALDVKQSKRAVSNLFLNLDGIASVRDRGNTPLGLPSLYKLGFTVDVDEEGYVRTGDDGGGEFATGVVEDSIVEQKSNFSFNWFKNITKEETGDDVVLPLPIISKNEVWGTSMPYNEAMTKRYTDQAYRFFYYDGLLNDLGATFEFNGALLKLAKVSNIIAGLSELDYKNQPYTILDNYFTILINGSSHYTELEGALTPYQYDQLDGTIMAMFNGDLYYIAELGGYDPTGKNKTKIKLIRKI